MLTLRPGEVQRWRLIHGGVRESIHLAIVREDDKGHLSPALPHTASGRLDVKALIKAGLRIEPLHVLAEDGIAYGRMDERTSLKLESGYRAGVLIKLDEPGSYQLVDLPSSPRPPTTPSTSTLIHSTCCARRARPSGRTRSWCAATATPR